MFTVKLDWVSEDLTTDRTLMMLLQWSHEDYIYVWSAMIKRQGLEQVAREAVQ